MLRSCTPSLVVFLWSLTLGVASAFSQVSAGFIENRGQVDPEVLYYAHGSGAAVYLTERAIVLDLPEKEPTSRPGAGAFDELEIPGVRGIDGSPWGLLVPGSQNRGSELHVASGEEMVVEAPRRRGCAIWVWFEGANPSPRVEAREGLPGKCNFFLGNDSSRWQTEVPTFREVVYRDLWPGVDLVWRVVEGELVYGAVSAPWADPGIVRFGYEGAEAVIPRYDGSLFPETPVGHPADNPSALFFSTFLGGIYTDFGSGLSFDPSGNLVLSGHTYSPNFPTTPGAYDESHNASSDVFVAKLDSSGSNLLYSTFLGGSMWDWGRDLFLDASGNPVVTGNTYSSDFPTTAGAYDEFFNDSSDVFVAKLDSSGSNLPFSTFLGGGNDDYGLDLSLHHSGNLVLTGSTSSSDFPMTIRAFDESHNDSLDVFVAELSASGSSLLYSTFMGGSGDDRGMVVLLDPSGNPVVAGGTNSSDFPTTPGAYDESHNGAGGSDVFVAKLDITRFPHVAVPYSLQGAFPGRCAESASVGDHE